MKSLNEHISYNVDEFHISEHETFLIESFDSENLEDVTNNLMEAYDSLSDEALDDIIIEKMEEGDDSMYESLLLSELDEYITTELDDEVFLEYFGFEEMDDLFEFLKGYRKKKRINKLKKQKVKRENDAIKRDRAIKKRAKNIKKVRRKKKINSLKDKAKKVVKRALGIKSRGEKYNDVQKSNSDRATARKKRQEKIRAKKSK